MQGPAKCIEVSEKYQGLGKELQLNLIGGDKVCGLPVVPSKAPMQRSWHQCFHVFLLMEVFRSWLPTFSTAARASLVETLAPKDVFPEDFCLVNA